MEDLVSVRLCHAGVDEEAGVPQLCDLLGQQLHSLHRVAKDDALVDLKLWCVVCVVCVVCVCVCVWGGGGEGTYSSVHVESAPCGFGSFATGCCLSTLLQSKHENCVSCEILRKRLKIHKICEIIDPRKPSAVRYLLNMHVVQFSK